MNGNSEKDIEKLYDKFDGFMERFSDFVVEQAGINASMKAHRENDSIHHEPPCSPQKCLTRLFWCLVTLNVVSIVTLAAAVISRG